MPGLTIRIAITTLLLCAAASAATPSVIQDTLYKADGSRFSGILQIDWKSFQTADGKEVPQQSLTVRVESGALRVSLLPTTNALKQVYYTVRYNSDGRTQFTETWAVPPSASLLRLRDVRIAAPAPGPITTPPPSNYTIQDIPGLRTELDLRPVRGTSWTANRLAAIGASGTLEAVIGNATDCVHVDGTSGPCASGGAGARHYDGEALQGAVDGVNATFRLNDRPTPASSLYLFRNGLLLKAGVDYNLSLDTVTFMPSTTPRVGDAMQAWYRVDESPSVSQSLVDGETPAGVVDGVNTQFTLAQRPAPVTSLRVFRNGLLLKAGEDYTLSLDRVTFVQAAKPRSGDVLQVSYRK